MAPCPDIKSFPGPKMLLELALAMLRLAPWLFLWGFKTDGWPLPQAQKMKLELALAMLRLAPSLVLWDFKTDGWPPVPISKASPSLGWFYTVSKLTDGPLSRSQRLPQALL